VGIVWIVPIVGAIAVLFAVWLARDVLARDKGTPGMQDIADMIFEGAMAFLRRQYQAITIMSVVVAIVIGLIVWGTASPVRDPRSIGEAGSIIGAGGGAGSVGAGEQGILAGVAFLVGAFCSAVAGYIGMYISVRSNLRTAAAAQVNLRAAITVALRGGAVSGFLVTGPIAAGRFEHLRHLQQGVEPSARLHALSDRRFRLWRQLRGVVCATRRWNLYKGGRRWRRPRWQNRSRHS